MKFSLHEDDIQDSEKSLSYFSDLFVAVSFIFLFLYTTNVIDTKITLVNQHQKTKIEKKQIQMAMNDKLSKKENEYNQQISHLRQKISDLQAIRSNSNHGQNKLATEMINKMQVISRYQKDKEIELNNKLDQVKKNQEETERLKFLILQLANNNTYLKGSIKDLNKMGHQLILRNKETRQKMRMTESEKNSLTRKINEQKQSKAKLSGELDLKITSLEEKENKIAKLQEQLVLRNLKVRKSFAKLLTENLKRKGHKLKVDKNTGNIILDYDDFKFPSDSHRLTRKMRKTLKKIIPTYAKTIFGHKLHSKLIHGVEIIGMASPTYAKKIVNTDNINNQAAIKYNMDLSFKRAKSIFNYIINPKLIKYKYQKNMLQHTRVSGRGQHAQEKIKSNFLECRKRECLKYQKVIIRFLLKD